MFRMDAELLPHYVMGWPVTLLDHSYLPGCKAHALNLCTYAARCASLLQLHHHGGPACTLKMQKEKEVL